MESGSHSVFTGRHHHTKYVVKDHSRCVGEIILKLVGILLTPFWRSAYSVAVNHFIM